MVTDKVEVETSERRLYNSLGVYGRAKLQQLKVFKEILDNKQQTVVYPKEPPLGKPVMPNMKIIDLVKTHLET